MGVTPPRGRRRRRRRSGSRSASRLRAALTARRVGVGAMAAVVLALAALGTVVFRRSRFELGPAPAGGRAPFTTSPAVPPYGVTRAVDAVRPCYGPSDSGVAVLDTVARAGGVTVVTVAVASDRGTAGYVEARPAGGGIAACLGRVVDAGGVWSAYVRQVDPQLGIVDRVLTGAASTASLFPERRAAEAAIEREARR